MRSDAPPPVLHMAVDPPPAPRTDARVEPAAASASTTNEPATDQEPPPSLLLSGNLVVEIDEASGKFVQTLVDGESDEVLRQWPSESQLAFARGVRAYLAALKGVF